MMSTRDLGLGGVGGAGFRKGSQGRALAGKGKWKRGRVGDGKHPGLGVHLQLHHLRAVEPWQALCEPQLPQL